MKTNIFPGPCENPKCLNMAKVRRGGKACCWACAQRITRTGSWTKRTAKGGPRARYRFRALSVLWWLANTGLVDAWIRKRLISPRAFGWVTVRADGAVEITPDGALELASERSRKVLSGFSIENGNLVWKRPPNKRLCTVPKRKYSPRGVKNLPKV